MGLSDAAAVVSLLLAIFALTYGARATALYTPGKAPVGFENPAPSLFVKREPGG